MCVYSLGFSISTDDHPYPPHRSVTLSPKSQIATNLTTCLFFMIILLYILGKVTIHHSSKVRFVPISTNLNLLKKNVIPSSSYCHFEITVLYLFLTHKSDDFIYVLLLADDSTLTNLRYVLHFCVHNLFNLIDLVEIIIRIIFFTNLGFLCIPKVLQCLIFFINLFNLVTQASSTIWVPFLVIILSNDIELNPGPPHMNNNFSGGFLSFCNWNLNTLSKDDFYRITLLEAHNTEYNYDIISLCETSLNDSTQVPENALPGYKFHSCNHPSGDRNGGVGIFYKETLPLRIRDDLSFDEVIVSELIFGHKKIFFTVLYRNPRTKAQSPEFDIFLLDLENLYKKIKDEKPYSSFFTGDFNGHSQSWYPQGDTNAEGEQLDNLFSNLNLTQIISEPTHFMRETCKPSCIDLIVTDQPNIVLDSGVRESLDPTVKHQIIFCKINFKIPPLPKHSRKIWHFNRANHDLINRAISTFPWELELSHKDPNHQVDVLNQTVLYIMSNFVPNEIKTIRPREPDWYNGNIKRMLRNLNKISKKYKRNGYKTEDKAIVDRLKNECHDAIINAKENYLTNLGARLANPTTTQKSYWKIMNKLLNKCKIPRIPPLFVQDKFITSCKEKASIFNNFFCSQCTPIENNSELPELRFLTNSRLSSFDIREDEINDIIQGLSAKKASGPDCISVNMIKLCGPNLCKPLKIIFDNILQTGIFPDHWKEANVTPVHKKNDKQTTSNYRPISLLPVLAKVYERIIFKNLYNYLISNNLITKNQSGFRPGDSCTNQLLSLVHEIQNAFDHKKCLEVRSVFLDMSKAFDKVWHEGLIFKLKQNGIDGNLLKLFQNYLTNRKQRVVLNGQESQWGNIKAGVPQGSVLGPLLFLVYINDLEEGINSFIKFFADDTSIFSIVHDPQISAEELNHDLQLINNWAHQWKMSFNPDPNKQAVEIIFSQKRRSPDHPPIFFNNIEVKRVNDQKHLGLILDSKLSFTKHISDKIATARKGIGMIKHLAPFLPLKSRDQIYKMHVRSHLDYCDMIYHIPVKTRETSDFDSTRTLNYQMSSLESTQYQAALAVTGAWKGTSRCKLYDELGWETLDQRRTFRRLTQFYKIMNGLTPDYLRIPIPSMRGHLFGHRYTNLLDNIFCRTGKYLNSFFPDTINLWNELGPELRGVESLSIFKEKLLKIYRPAKKSLYDIHDQNGTKWIFQLRLGLSHLKSHKKSHNFLDTPDDTCKCKLHSETSDHYLLHCPIFIEQRRELFLILNPILLENNMRFLDYKSLVHLLLYGNNKFNDNVNRSILKATIKFIRSSSRFTPT